MGLLEPVVAVGGLAVASGAGVTYLRHRREAQRLQLLYRLARQVGDGTDLETGAAELLGELRRVLRAGRVEMTLLHDDRWRRTTLAGGHESPRVHEGVGTPPEAAVLRSGTLHVARLGARSSLRAALLERLGSGGVLAPLLAGTTLVGSVGAGHPVGRRTFADQDLRLLDVLARHLGSALDHRRLERRLRHDSAHDGLTGLPNRARFAELLDGLPDPSTVLLIDLDHFREVNDTLGHAHGDRLLRQAARRLATEVGRAGIVARLGGDEFGVLAPRAGATEAAPLAARLLAAVAQPFVVADVCLEITASIGVAVQRGPAPEPSRLLLEAEVAMYAAKSSGRGWEFYAPEHDHHSRERLTLVAELRRAIDGDELEVHYQPKVDLRSGAVFGMEALVRWRHPERGLLGPDVFVPVAEEAGLIRPLTLRVLDAAAQEHRALSDLGFGHLEVAVNLSLRSMVELDFPDQVAKVLRRHGVPPTALTLEITESSVLSDPARTVGMLVRLAELGTTISVDDFGTGYASLSHLKRLPAGELKIDRSFVAGMLDAPRDAAIVSSTIDLARKLGLRAVAEGVEDGDTWAALAELGCDQVQGYFVSRPLPPPQLEAWLMAKRTGPSTSRPRTSGGARAAALRAVPSAGDGRQAPEPPAPPAAPLPFAGRRARTGATGGLAAPRAGTGEWDPSGASAG